ncbi:hypothetical protein K4K58_011420 [Colletotrichum sp. SAR11_239]|nr:hypothetical protein K4K58_011420 [Colletotrichum sp. SAR11_239]
MEGVTWSDLLDGKPKKTKLSRYLPALKTHVKLSNAPVSSTSEFVKTEVKIVETPTQFPRGFFGNFKTLLEAEQLSQSAMDYLVASSRIRGHRGEASSDTTFKAHYLPALLHVLEENGMDFEAIWGEAGYLSWDEQSQMKVATRPKGKGIETFIPDHTLNCTKDEPFTVRATTNGVAILEAKGPKIVARCTEEINYKLKTGAKGQKWSKRTRRLLQQVSAYAIVYRLRYVVLYDDDVVVLIRFDNLKKWTGRPNFIFGLGNVMRMQVVEDRNLWIRFIARFLVEAVKDKAIV